MARKWPVRSSGQSPADQGLTGRLEGAFDGEVDCLGQRRTRLAGGETVEGLLGLLAVEAGAGPGIGNGAVALAVAQSLRPVGFHIVGRIPGPPTPKMTIGLPARTSGV